MNKTRTIERNCELKGIRATFLEECLGELGSGNEKWDIRKCLSKEDDCNDLDCRYVIRGIGDCGSKDPFKKY